MIELSTRGVSRPTLTAVCGGLAAVLIVAHIAAVPQEPRYDPLLTRVDAMIPMRDGVRLYTEIFTPRDASGALPILFERTPYGVLDDEQGIARGVRGLDELLRDGYILVFQDIRGRYKSEGQFVMQRKPRTDRRDPRAVDESTDAYDTIAWLLANVKGNDGNVGMLGLSYGAWLTTMAALDPHPALKAAVEQASPADMFLGDDFHHNGAFRLSYGFEYAARMETGKTQVFFTFDRADTFDWFLKLGPLSNVNDRYFHGEKPTWNDFVDHPNYDAFWQRQAFAPYLTRVTIPMLNVAGWWDQEDFYGPQKIYELLEQHDTDHRNYFVAGPWNHGGWGRGTGDRLGPVPFGSKTSEYYRGTIQSQWFAHWLKQRDPLPLGEALTFQTGSNVWQQFDAWPPRRGIEAQPLYFAANGTLSFQKPTSKSERAFDSYVSDPAHPVPYRHRPINATYGAGPGWSTWLLEDQRFVDQRPDVLSWSTEPLGASLTISGDIVAHLFASSSGTDSDWIVKLIDVYPEDEKDPAMRGYELIIADEVLRARFRDSFERPKPIVPSAITSYTIDLHTNNHQFLSGHRVMVQVQSTWFPLIDRNPQTFVLNIFRATAADYRSAVQRVYRSPSYPSHIVLPVNRNQRFPKTASR
ncbi:MAG TPA: CocE/NonD family hydrolase [Vicinamibacterales bacterium]|nr:CocE/NonD family hydrolase [Vicinamibacterales bacterium]